MVLLSGGIDSAACAYLLESKGFKTQALFVDYGQPAAPHERLSSSKIAGYLGIPLHEVKLIGADQARVGEVLGRNAFFVFAALLATRGAANLIALGIHAGTPYFDCSAEFSDEISKCVAHHTQGRVSLFTPFVTWGKADVYEYFKSTKIPIELTYSCEAGGDVPCAQCASCRDRESLT